MEKRTKIILFILSILISVAMILLSYFGLVRYAMLHINSSEGYIKNYSELDQGDKKVRVVISFTTTPDRIAKIRPMLNSLLDQTVKVDQIALNLPYRHKGQSYDVPKEYEDVVTIFKVGKDFGPGTKILPTLLREGECNTKIIYLDDDHIYGKDFVETMIDASNKYPDSAIYTKEDMNASGGVLIKPEFFDVDVIDHEMEYFNDRWMRKRLKAKRRKVAYGENFRLLNM